MFVLRALAANDERIIEEFRTISRGQKLSGRKMVVFNFAEILPVKIEAEKFAQSIQLQAWGKLALLDRMSYEESQQLVKSLGLKNQKQWRAWRSGKRPDLPPVPPDHPGNPEDAYRNQGWTSWGAFFDSGFVWSGYKKFLPFNEARAFVRSLGLKSVEEWMAYSGGRLPGKPKRPANDIPARPDVEYSKVEHAKAWTDWPDFMGYKNNYDKNWWPFEQARAWVHKLELWRYRPQGGGQVSWKAYCSKKIPNLPPRPENNIPTAPDSVYKESGWKGFPDWVGSPQAK
jgi:hypothetical protein